MNDDPSSGGTSTATPPPPAPGPTDRDQGPRVSSEEARDLSRLRRSADDRKVLGVCGGLARQLDLDPTLVRVVVAVLVLFGGAGLLLYLGAWLFVPDERTGRAVVHLDGSARTAALVVVAGLSALTALGQGWGGPLGGWGGWWFLTPFPVLVLLAAGAVVWFSGRQRRSAPPVAGPAAPVPAAPAPTGYAPPTAPTRVLPAYTPPSRPRRSGPLLFWPTLAVIAVALGALGLYDASGGAVADGAYAALALAVTGVGLVVGAFWGRPGGLVLLALVSVLSTGLGVLVGSAPSGDSVTAAPTSAAQVAPTYRIGNGSLRLDLTGVDPAQLDGRRIDLDARSGVVEVVLPDGVGARVDADIDLAGSIEVAGTSSAGFAPHRTATVDAPAGAPVVDLDIDSRLGAIYVRSQS